MVFLKKRRGGVVHQPKSLQTSAMIAVATNPKLRNEYLQTMPSDYLKTIGKKMYKKSVNEVINGEKRKQKQSIVASLKNSIYSPHHPNLYMTNGNIRLRHTTEGHKAFDHIANAKTNEINRRAEMARRRRDMLEAERMKKCKALYPYAINSHCSIL